MNNYELMKRAEKYDEDFDAIIEEENSVEKAQGKSAKNIVAAGLADRAEVELAYAIGVPFPVSIMVETFGTEKAPRNAIEAAVEKVFDCTPAGIIKTLNLKQPIYRKTASYGHFGREGFPWEKTDKVEELRSALK